MTIVCGDSHTSTHGAFGAIAFGIGTSEVEMVLSSQCIMQPKPKKMRINVKGKLGKAVTPKDVTLYIIAKLTTAGATGYFVEYAGDVFITTKVKAALFNEPTLKSTEINVETFKGRVQLSGFVSTQANASTAVTVARGVAGVVDVKDDMRLK